MERKNGHMKLFEQLRADGINVIFGNPGSSEEGLVATLVQYPDIQYILALQETIAVAAADGYARSTYPATQKPALIQLHTGVGLGNGIGMLYQAFRGHSPLVVIAGESGIAYDAHNAQMYADLIAMARPVTKYAARVVHPGSLLRVLRRAIKIAATPPTGPVFVSVPQDILDAPNDEDVVPTVIPSTRAAPDAAEIERAADILRAAQNPLILMGDGVGTSGGQAELARLAETIGAGVWGVNSAEVNLPQSHPLFCGLTGHMFAHDSTPIVRDADVVLICGTYVFPEVFPSIANPFKPGARIIHVDLDAFEIAKNFPVELAFVSDPKLTLGRLADAVAARATESEKAAAADRANAIGARNHQALEQAKAADAARRTEVPLHMAAFTEELAKQLPKDAIVFDEALTNSADLCRYVVPEVPGQYFQTRGGSLGVALPGAIGIKVAHPDRTVVGISGDGGAMYVIQGLWTAAHHRIAAKFVICNNHSYRILKLNLLDYWQELGMPPGTFPPSFDLRDPDLDFAGMAKAFSVPGVRVESYEQIAPAIKEMLQHDGPFLIDLAITGAVPVLQGTSGGAGRTGE